MSNLGSTDTCPQAALPSMGLNSDKCRCRLRQEAVESPTGFTSCAAHTDNRPNKNYRVAMSTTADCPCHPRVGNHSFFWILSESRV